MKLHRCFGLVLLLLSALSTQSASASFVLILNDLNTSGIDVVVIDDQLAGSVSDSFPPQWTSNNADVQLFDPGFLSYSGSVGSFIVNFSSGFSDPVIGPNRIDLLSGNVSGVAGGVMEVWLIDTGFTDNGRSFQTSLGGTTDGSVAFTSIVGTTNLELTNSGNAVAPDAGSVIIDSGAFGSGAFSVDSVSVNPLAGGLYSMAVGMKITHAGGTNRITSFDYSLTQVPEPGSLAILSMLGIVTLARRRSRQVA